MTCQPLADLTADQLGLVARAIDGHRRSLVRNLRRIHNPDERARVLNEINDLEHSGSLFKQTELGLLRETE